VLIFAFGSAHVARAPSPAAFAFALELALCSWAASCFGRSVRLKLALVWRAMLILELAVALDGDVILELALAFGWRSASALRSNFELEGL
jgi:hypothetical protein